MGCFKSRKLQNEIETFHKLELYLEKEDNYFRELLEEYNEAESMQDHSCLAEKYEISTHLNMLQDLILYLRKQKSFESDKKRQKLVLEEFLDILDIYEKGKKENFKVAEINEEFQDKVDYIVIKEKKQEY